MNALVGGQVDYMCDQIVNAVPQVQGGTIKAYAIGTAGAQSVAAERADHQGSRHAGVPGLGLERAVRAQGHAEGGVDKLSDALDKALDDEATRKRLLDLGSDIPGKDRRGGPALTTLVRAEIAKLDAGDQGGRHRPTELVNLCKSGQGAASSRPFSVGVPI